MKIFTFLFALLSSLITGTRTIIRNPTINPPNITETIVPTVVPTVVPTIAPAANPSPTVDETGLIKTDIRQALVAKHGNTANESTITVFKIVGNYSSGGASASGGGGMWFAAKVNDAWQLVWDGNGVILCSDLTSYPGFPVSLIPECYDDSTNKSVKR